MNKEQILILLSDIKNLQNQLWSSTKKDKEVDDRYLFALWTDLSNKIAIKEENQDAIAQWQLG